MRPPPSATRCAQLLRTQGHVKNGIIFANRKTTVALLEKSLRTHGFNAGALHGDMDQSARMKMLAGFRNNEITYLIASDVAARGLDIPEVSATSSISTCRPMPRIMCIASAAPGAPGAKARPSRW